MPLSALHHTSFNRDDMMLSPGHAIKSAAAGSNGYYRPTMSGRRQDIPKPVPEVKTIDDLAGYLQVSKSSLYKLAQVGRVPGQKVGRHWRFSRVVIDKWLAAKPTGPQETNGYFQDSRTRHTQAHCARRDRGA